MNQTSGIGSSRGDRPPAEFVFSTPSSAKLAAVGQETVLNQEGRRLGTPGNGSSTFDVVPSSADSRIWRRLFPGEVEYGGGEADGAAVCELGHFTIEERIGAGGMGAVFRALDARLQRVVALKVLSPSQSGDRASVLRFQNEARAAARLDHENIARVYYVGEDRGLHFIAFEYVTGQNVRDLIGRAGRLPVADSVNYTLQIAAALRHTAAAGVVHRDIKPSNIIITPNGRAKLVDLGLARKLAADSVGDLTIAGTTLGTFDYISPEQARDPRNVDVRSDIYSLGCTLYHMLTGGPPYSSGTVLQKLLDHQSGHAPDPRSVNPLVPPALSAICRKMMAGEPKARYATPDDLIRDLASVAAPLGLRPMPADSYVWSRPKAVASPRMRSGLIWAASLGVVVFLAFAVDPPWKGRVGEQVADRPIAAKSLDARPASSRRDDTPIAPSLPPAQDEPRIRPEPLETAEATGRLSLSPGASARAPGDPVASERAISPPAKDRGNAADGASPVPAASAAATDQGGLDDLLQLADPVRRLAGAFWPTESAASGPSAAPSATQSAEPIPFEVDAPFVLLSPSGEPNLYDSLSQAVHAAFDGDVIELHYDGPAPSGPAEPFTVRGKAITIRAGSDRNDRRYRPLVEFAADSDRAPYGETRMITVSGQGGSLAIDGAEVRLAAQGEAHGGAGRWVLFSLSDSEQVRLSDTVVTLANPDAWPATVFDLRPPDNVSAEELQMMGVVNADRDAGFGIELRRCLVRGEADLMTIAHTLPGRIAVEDSALALREALIRVSGGIEMPIVGNRIDVTLDHVTAVVGPEVLQVDLASGHQMAPFRFDARNNLLATTAAAGQVVSMAGDKPSSSFEEALAWNGRGNVFVGFTGYWTIFGDDGSRDAGSPSFVSWKSQWTPAGAAAADSTEREIVPDSIDVWIDAEAAKYDPRSEATAEDLALDAASGLLGALDGGLVGARPGRLPAAAPLSPGFEASTSPAASALGASSR